MATASSSDTGAREPGQAAGAAGRPHHPSYIGIHTRDEDTRALYLSSGLYAATGLVPERIINLRVKDFIADDFDADDLPWLYGAKGQQGGAVTATSAAAAADEEDEADMADAYTMILNVKTASGAPVVQRVTTFKLDTVVVYVSVAFPEIPPRARTDLKVQLLNRSMKQLNISQRRRASAHQRQKQQQQQQQQQQKQSRSGQPSPSCMRKRQAKAAFILEYHQPAPAESGPAEPTEPDPMGARIGFVTGSVSSVVDADASDLIHGSFLKLVAPEDLARAGQYFDRVSKSATDVLFERLSLLERPCVVEGDIAVPDEDNRRVAVDCLAASSHDGVMLLVRKLHVMSAPRRDSSGNYIRTRVHEVDDDAGYISLAEFISSDPETSDAPEWSQLL
ncbi:hypothetical protein H4R18_001536 [Coemansia javaensis]|uniref:PAS domain-containing protein n=1 Tax=Coemansia javaensis TaxID=2761396 RepID=A0A9W8LLG8_9FUNG|nr:hypothetical protein H4R18_001536 [Coemansia javaensis]